MQFLSSGLHRFLELRRDPGNEPDRGSDARPFLAIVSLVRRESDDELSHPEHGRCVRSVAILSATPGPNRAAAPSSSADSRARTMVQARAIVDAARRLVARKGERFTTHDLVKEAGVGLPTFYRH